MQRQCLHCPSPACGSGSLGGIVTQTDLLEAIAGDLPDTENEEPDIIERDDGSLLIGARSRAPSLAGCAGRREERHVAYGLSFGTGAKLARTEGGGFAPGRQRIRRSGRRIRAARRTRHWFESLSRCRDVSYQMKLSEP
jgi:hypothetical protein